MSGLFGSANGLARIASSPAQDVSPGSNEVKSSRRIVAGDRRAVAFGDFGLRGFRQQAELTVYCELK